MTINFKNVLPMAVSFIFSVSEVLAEICDDGMRCSGDKKCCSTGCCYDDSENGGYTYGYRLSIWNMWYFWFVVLFILMSCFGGCGYYKQRQRVLRNQPGLGNPFLSVFQVTSRRLPNSSIVTLETASYPPQSDYGYGASPEADVILSPPPYSEVMNNPGMFPSNTKSGYPASTGQPFVTANLQSGGQSVQSGNESTIQMPQPPPYSEVANQNTADMFTANRYIQGSNPATNQEAAN